MAVICPQCSLENPDNSTFCRRCGTPLMEISEAGTGGIGAVPFSVPPAEPIIQQGFPSPSPFVAPARPPYEQMQPQDSYAPAHTAPPPPSIPLVTQLGKRAFAGYGMPVSRASWLIPDQQAQANALLTATGDDLTQQGLPGLSINSPRLTERAFMIEYRNYLTAHRGSASVFVYITPAGRDLYIARTTTAQTPFSFPRLAILALLLILMVIGLAQSGSPPATTGSFSLGAAISTILINFSYPLLLFFLVLIVASLLAWLIHGDAGMYLRPATLNDFQADDALILEESVDNSLRSAAQTLNIDAGKISVSGQKFRVRRRIRWI
ncbi:MAG TPA: zinc-ribbon domain-containing protein [Ktedonobacteraceae bacterium]